MKMDPLSVVDSGTIYEWNLNNNSNASGSCSNESDCSPAAGGVNPNDMMNSFIPSAFFQVIIYTLYLVIFVLALIGNLVVVAVVFASVRKWTVRND